MIENKLKDFNDSPPSPFSPSPLPSPSPLHFFVLSSSVSSSPCHARLPRCPPTVATPCSGRRRRSYWWTRRWWRRTRVEENACGGERRWWRRMRPTASSLRRLDCCSVLFSLVLVLEPISLLPLTSCSIPTWDCLLCMHRIRRRSREDTARRYGAPPPSPHSLPLPASRQQDVAAG